MKTIAIIEGGYSLEKEISIKSAETVYKYLDSEQLFCIRVRIDEEGWNAFYKGKWLEINRHDFTFSVRENPISFDYAFIVIHGTPGEDGKLQAYFDLLEIPYSTSGQMISALTFNKAVCNHYLSSFDIPVAKSIVFHQKNNQTRELIIEQIILEIGFPCFVKPTESGSSFGVSRVDEVKGLSIAMDDAFEHGEEIIIEAFLDGQEVSNGVYQSYTGIHVLPITEIKTDNAFFDFDAKYQGKSEEITPAEISEESTLAVKQLTKTIYKLLNLKGVCRIDYMLTEKGPVVIELNTVPGFTQESMIPKMAECEGISLGQLFTDVVEYTQNP